MPVSTPRPGWYPDPADRADERWWDGTAWADATRTSGTVHVAGGAARRRVSPWLWVVPLVALLGGGVAFALTGDGPAVPELAEGELAESAGDEVEDPDGAEDQPVDGAGSPTAASEEPAEDTEPDDDLLEIELDGRCEVTVPASDRPRSQGGDGPELRAWRFPSCSFAPVDLDADDEGRRWMVVVASLNGMEHDAQDARDRAAAVGLPGQVLWSTHYPSLNPDLWVVFDGPFPDETAARAAADRRGGGAYERVLSAEDDDRFCLAADGCVGERG